MRKKCETSLIQQSASDDIIWWQQYRKFPKLRLLTAPSKRKYITYISV